MGKTLSHVLLLVYARRAFRPARQEIPDAGKLRMNSSIEWLKDEERGELIREFSKEGAPAFVFQLEEVNRTRWAVLGFCAAAVLFCGATAPK